MNRLKWVPNGLSVLRFLLIIPLSFLLLNFKESHYLHLLIIYLLAIGLDFLDGFLARRLNAITSLGKILDPLADKMFVLILVVLLVIKTDFPFWLAMAIFFRDICILLGSFRLIRKKIGVKPSILVGKVTFALLSLLIFVYLLDFSKFVFLAPLKQYLIPLTFSFLFWSYFEYYKIFRNLK